MFVTRYFPPLSPTLCMSQTLYLEYWKRPATHSFSLLHWSEPFYESPFWAVLRISILGLIRR